MDASYGKEGIPLLLKFGKVPRLPLEKAAGNRFIGKTVIYSIHFQVLYCRFIAGFADCHFA